MALVTRPGSGRWRERVRDLLSSRTDRAGSVVEDDAELGPPVLGDAASGVAPEVDQLDEVDEVDEVETPETPETGGPVRAPFMGLDVEVDPASGEGRVLGLLPQQHYTDETRDAYGGPDELDALTDDGGAILSTRSPRASWLPAVLALGAVGLAVFAFVGRKRKRTR